MQDEDYFCQVSRVERFFNDAVAVADVVGCVVEVTLNKALEDVEEDAVPRVCEMVT